jgi:hypothetical protein
MTQSGHEQPRIPEFSNREDEAAWFDSHDIGDYINEFERVNLKVTRNLSMTIQVELTCEEFAQLQRKADEKGVGTSTLVRMWILENL